LQTDEGESGSLRLALTEELESTALQFRTAATGQAEFWNSGVLSGATFIHQFTQIGPFHYHSAPFGFDNLNRTAGGMSGIITVVPEPAHFALLLALALTTAIALRRRPAI